MAVGLRADPERQPFSARPVHLRRRSAVEMDQGILRRIDHRIADEAGHAKGEPNSSIVSVESMSPSQPPTNPQIVQLAERQASSGIAHARARCRMAWAFCRIMICLIARNMRAELTISGAVGSTISRPG